MRKVIISGYGPMTLEVLRGLPADHFYSFVVVRDEYEERIAKEEEVTVFRIDLSVDENLRRIGLGGEVYALFLLGDDEAYNLFVTLSARALDPKLLIIAKAMSSHSKHKLRLAGTSRVIEPFEMAATRIVQIFRHPTVVEILERHILRSNPEKGGEDVELEEIVLPENSILEGVNLEEARLAERFGLIPVGIIDLEKSEKVAFSFDGESHRINVGDTLVVLGRKRDIERFIEELIP